MEMTTREFWSMVHGVGFGGLYLLGCTGAMVELWRRYAPSAAGAVTAADEWFMQLYLGAMTVLAWLAVLSGTYIVYPWYRAAPGAGATDLSRYPQRLLLASPATAGWHSIGMEWKEHVAWLTPIAITMSLAVCVRYGKDLRNQPLLRSMVLGFVLASMVAAGIAGFWGAEITSHAPVRGGSAVQLLHGGSQ
ncbi:MAG: hypothetical protein KGJ51_06850 [Acidobacteriota bacterium]|nr:hypothetical protein [Acidobacteriota bacterium]